MGREIRMVPENWEHPRDEEGHYKALYDKDYDTAAREYEQNFLSWSAGVHEDFEKHGSDYPYYWEWTSNPPDKEYYRPAFSEPATCFQIYETVSEGTPTSPVFADRRQLVTWLIKEGHTRKAAVMFARDGWVPSMVFSLKTGIVMGINSAGID